MAYRLKVCYHKQVAWSETRNISKYGGPIEKLASCFHDQEICCQDRHSEQLFLIHIMGSVLVFELYTNVCLIVYMNFLSMFSKKLYINITQYINRTLDITNLLIKYLFV